MTVTEPYKSKEFDIFFGICPVVKDYCIFYRKSYKKCLAKVTKGISVEELKTCPVGQEMRLGIARTRR